MHLAKFEFVSVEEKRVEEFKAIAHQRWRLVPPDATANSGVGLLLTRACPL